ncbi:MAG: type II secretion system protein GspE, partial [Planctomycetes bacterium]|nr:type II secretion system protein GspE [Planctomycetota bacterium]
KCFDTGYKGRTGIYELLLIDDDIREMIHSMETAGAIKTKCLQKGLQTLRMDGARKVLSGITSIAEVLRVTQSDV